MRLLQAACLLVVCAALSQVRAAAPDSAAADERLVKSAGLGVDGPALLAFLIKRGTPPDPERATVLLRQFIDPEAKETDKIKAATAEGADYLVANDSGCLMHLAGLIHRRTLPMKTMHLAELLAKQE